MSTASILLESKRPMQVLTGSKNLNPRTQELETVSRTASWTLPWQVALLTFVAAANQGPVERAILGETDFLEVET